MTVAEAEREACRGVVVGERDEAPWGSGVESVRALRERDPRNLGSLLRGAEIEVVAAPGLTRAWLERRARCHAARHRTGVLPDAASDPLAVGAPEIEVEEAGPSLVVIVRGGSTDDNREILLRARALPRAR